MSVAIIKAKRLNSLSSVFGLMFGIFKPPVCFKARFGIHTFFVSNPIDVIILDNMGRIVKLIENFKPNKILFWGFTIFTVIECEKNYIRRKNIKSGTKVIIV